VEVRVQSSTPYEYIRHFLTNQMTEPICCSTFCRGISRSTDISPWK
jgi:hypothetical protein